MPLYRAAVERSCTTVMLHLFQPGIYISLLKSWESVKLRADPEQLHENGNNLLHRKLTSLFVALDTVSSCFQSFKSLKAFLILVSAAAFMCSAALPSLLIGGAIPGPGSANCSIPALGLKSEPGGQSPPRCRLLIGCPGKVGKLDIVLGLPPAKNKKGGGNNRQGRGRKGNLLTVGKLMDLCPAESSAE